MTGPRTHDAVIHPAEWLKASEEELTGLRRQVAVVNDWLASHLGLVFGSVWIVWVFFLWPLIAQFESAIVQQKTSYYSQSWVQLFALPLFVYIGNKLQRTSDAQSDVQHQALTHIANVGDDVKTLLQLNNDLTAEVHKIVKGSS